VFDVVMLDGEGLRLARRVLKAAGGRQNELLLRVAIENDRVGRRLAEEDKRRVVTAIDQHFTGIAPLPSRGETYSKKEWHDMGYDVPRAVVAALGLPAEAAHWRREALGAMGNDDRLFERVFRGFCKTPARFIDTMLGTMEVDFRHHTAAGTRQAVQQLVAMMMTERIPRYREYLAALSDFSLYRKDTDPQVVFDRLRHSYASHCAESLLAVLHGVKFGRPCTDTVPMFYDVCERNISIHSLLARQQAEKEVEVARRAAWTASYITAMIRVAEVLRPLQTAHLSTVNRVLHQALPGFHIERSGRGAKDVAMLTWPGGTFAGPAAARADAVGALLGALDAYAAKATPGMSDIDEAILSLQVRKLDT